MSADTSGPAFPADEWVDSEDPAQRNPVMHMGISVRDYFAAKAMQGLCADPSCDLPPDDMAVGAYRIADAMLKERSK